MEYNEIINRVENIKPGVFKRFTYKTELPLKARYKKDGYKVVKVTTMTSRFGIHYGNLKSVKEKSLNKTLRAIVNKEKAFSWIVENRICYNKNTNKLYVCSYPCKSGKNSSSNYILIKDDQANITDIEGIKEYVTPSYFTKKNDSSMMRIAIENIVSI